MLLNSKFIHPAWKYYSVTEHNRSVFKEERKKFRWQNKQLLQEILISDVYLSMKTKKDEPLHLHFGILWVQKSHTIDASTWLNSCLYVKSGFISGTSSRDFVSSDGVLHLESVKAKTFAAEQTGQSWF